MIALQLPCTIFTTKKCMDNYTASDIRCRDLNEAQPNPDTRWTIFPTGLIPGRLTGSPQFGYSSKDILATQFCQFHFFRIWFVLQRYNQFGFRPFMTNMESTIEITGTHK